METLEKVSFVVELDSSTFQLLSQYGAERGLVAQEVAEECLKETVFLDYAERELALEMACKDTRAKHLMLMMYIAKYGPMEIGHKDTELAGKKQLRIIIGGGTVKAELTDHLVDSDVAING